MRIALLEMICGSGFFHADHDGHPSAAPSSLLAEGFAMLYSFASDLVCSGHRVRIPLEASIAAWASRRGFDLTPFEICPISPQDVSLQNAPCWTTTEKIWTELALPCDIAVVIAPELDGMLTSMVRAFREAEIALIASDAQFLNVATDKWLTACHLAAAGIPHPPTILLETFLENPSSLTSSSGWVVKRRFGAGGTDMKRFATRESIISFAHSSDPLWQSTSDWIVQPWVQGTPASLAIIAGPTSSEGMNFATLGAFEQKFHATNDFGSPISYAGGTSPLGDFHHDQLHSIAEHVLAALPGYPRGWIGIDFVANPIGPSSTSSNANHGWVVIEINARQTSSYLGYRKIYGVELADAIVCGRTPMSKFRMLPPCSFSVDDFHG
ncbi:MAG: ATP-grasp domain-containing protein [Planctomycetes bacterium]|nr:ATP-grasp domain-containing protein [Planctomycetota bacterium]